MNHGKTSKPTAAGQDQRLLLSGSDGEDQPIAGLYAAGTDMASIMGGHYSAGGINLGRAVTFGYIAGRHIAGASGWE